MDRPHWGFAIAGVAVLVASCTALLRAVYAEARGHDRYRISELPVEPAVDPVLFLAGVRALLRHRAGF